MRTARSGQLITLRSRRCAPGGRGSSRRPAGRRRRPTPGRRPSRCPGSRSTGGRRRPSPRRCSGRRRRASRLSAAAAIDGPMAAGAVQLTPTAITASTCRRHREDVRGALAPPGADDAVAVDHRGEREPDRDPERVGLGDQRLRLGGGGHGLAGQDVGAGVGEDLHPRPVEGAQVGDRHLGHVVAGVLRAVGQHRAVRADRPGDPARRPGPPAPARPTTRSAGGPRRRPRRPRRSPRRSPGSSPSSPPGRRRRRRRRARRRSRPGRPAAAAPTRAPSSRRARVPPVPWTARRRARRAPVAIASARERMLSILPRYRRGHGLHLAQRRGRDAGAASARGTAAATDRATDRGTATAGATAVAVAARACATCCSSTPGAASPRASAAACDLLSWRRRARHARRAATGTPAWPTG